MTTTTEVQKKIKITMSEMRPIQILESDWPLIARADRHDARIACEANHKWAIRVRQHADGRRLVYGWLREGPGGSYAGWRGAEGGFLVRAGEQAEAETIRAIRRIGGIVEDDKLAAEAISDLPPEELPAEGALSRSPLALSSPETHLAWLLALLVRARPYCPTELQDEIRAALSGRGT